jgi:hypothetical protein
VPEGEGSHMRMVLSMLDVRRAVGWEGWKEQEVQVSS